MAGRYRMAANSATGTAQGAPQGKQSASANRGRFGSTFHPTVASLLILVLIEAGTYVTLRRYFRHAHGG